jgi:hypothetical protein
MAQVLTSLALVPAGAAAGQVYDSDLRVQLEAKPDRGPRTWQDNDRRAGVAAHLSSEVHGLRAEVSKASDHHARASADAGKTWEKRGHGYSW